MRQRTFDCQDCGSSVTVPLTTGRPRIYCDDCLVRRRAEKAKAARDASRVAFTVCQRPGCDNPIPDGSRADRKWCSGGCQSWSQRRTSGMVKENEGTCPSCLESLAGKQANATQCGSLRCAGWLARNPGVPHPSTRPRTCQRCEQSIDHRNAKARFCSTRCKDLYLIESDREAYNAKARAWQSTEKAKAYRKGYQQANATRRQQWARENRRRDPERYSAYWRQWADANAEAIAEVKRMRRAREIGNPGSVGITARDWSRLLNRYDGCCAYCGVRADEIHMDHVVPLARGGRHAIGNVLPACKNCNLRKHAMFLSVWRYRGRRRRLSA